MKRIPFSSHLCIRTILGASLCLLNAARPCRAANSCIKDGNWHDPSIWLLNQVPGTGEDVSVPAGRTVTLTNTTAYLSTFDLQGTFVFDARDATLRATTVTLGGTVTHNPNSDVYAADGWQPDKRVNFECVALVLAGTINVDDKGYRGGQSAGSNGNGPGGSIAASAARSSSWSEQWA